MPGGRVFVEKPEVLDQLIESSTSESHKTQKSRVLSLSSHETVLEEASRRAQQAIENNRKLLIEQKKGEAQRTDAIMKANIQKSIRKNNEKKEMRYNSLKDDVETARMFLKTVDKSLQIQKEANHNKIRRQFDDWNNTVHGKIQGNISSQVNNMDYKDINRKGNDDFQKYLDMANKKTAIFRDIIIESEYDPLEPNRRAIKAITGKLKDPTNISQQKREEEQSMLGPEGEGVAGGGNSKRFLSKSRYTLPVEHWATGKIEATAHGKFSQMMDDSRRDRKITTAPATFQSAIHFDDYNIPKGRTVIDEEMPRGKKVFPALSAAQMKAVVNYDGPNTSKVISGSGLNKL
mmetsp:Transcript_26554/g.26801  ORF Transcript_26554/g.26801 Transcript_26554/m.26801 type:complete len:347 (+) Transcript_26554:228-1268(+)|eukprot:CAMPEP_0182429202 /NCGR_PEP_ID=MMETSP1167-20130531/25592_1 /TAXON_ID=2988 /ORGANISM="Mallomonas Sp, Strain CCMP3275" /LENGTH=346 /DNA_ID=CAMNT_0024612585 /DNA_START=117 /DNA_END=1157 /DNA_ORIENTATION=+